MNNPKITVITVTYNCARTLEETIKSVVNQNYNNLEYIIIDGGSIDGTVDIINKYASQITYFISEPDKGIYDAMNKGINVANGDYIYFLGGDDKLHNGILNQISPLLSDPNTTYYGDVLLQPSSKKYAGKFNSFKIVRMNICHQAIFYCKKVFDNNCRYDLQYKMYADYVLNISLFADKTLKFQYLNVVIADFQLAGQSSQGDKLFFENRCMLIHTQFSTVHYIYYLIRVALISNTMTKLRGIKDE